MLRAKTPARQKQALFGETPTTPRISPKNQMPARLQRSFSKIKQGGISNSFH
jgi:hypothetical protein